MKKFFVLALLLSGFFFFTACGPQEIVFDHPPVEVTVKNDSSKTPESKKEEEAKEPVQPEVDHFSPSIATSKSCKNNAACWNGSVCESGDCVTLKKWECAIHRDCAEGQLCSWGKCVEAASYQHQDPPQFTCKNDWECSVLGMGKGKSLCSKGTCSPKWDGGVVHGCQIYFDKHADVFVLYEDETHQFDKQKLRVLVAAYRNGKRYLVQSKATIVGLHVQIPDWASCFQLIDEKDFVFSLYQCNGQWAIFTDYNYPHKLDSMLRYIKQ
ncbi:hypothetical protein KKC60_05490 [Patescibacteria group bacterium]|nr:hypothetical protein [Patescibacteria group bacterium]